VLVAVDEDAEPLREVEVQLRDRYARHYRVVCLRSPAEALACLEGFVAHGEPVALVLAGHELGDERDRAAGKRAAAAPAGRRDRCGLRLLGAAGRGKPQAR
jgi:hypothetical protein